eukprot:7980617-Alexandrium_andersonii.AAC.1
MIPFLSGSHLRSSARGCPGTSSRWQRRVSQAGESAGSAPRPSGARGGPWGGRASRTGQTASCGRSP